MTTLHTYPDLIHNGGRLAATAWNFPGCRFPLTASDAVAATLDLDSEAVILRVADSDGRYVAVGLAPGGLAA